MDVIEKLEAMGNQIEALVVDEPTADELGVEGASHLAIAGSHLMLAEEAIRRRRKAAVQ